MNRHEHPEVWRPLTGMPDQAREWERQEYVDLAQEWIRIQSLLKEDLQRQFMDAWLRERGRLFAVETGQIEGLYTMRRGITEQIIVEGFASITSSHTIEDIDDGILRGLLADQETAYNMLFSDVVDEAGLTQHKIRSWHQILTRHQKTVTGLMADGHRMRRVEVPFREKGRWKTIPNNPRRTDGNIHEYCPPEHVQAEMDRFIGFHGEIEAARYPVETEAAWMHHRFVRTHPFRDGNGRVARMLMAYAYIRRGLPPPVITNAIRSGYIRSLEAADRGDLRPFNNFLYRHAISTLEEAVEIGNQALEDRLERPNGNGGRTIVNVYHPPGEGESDRIRQHLRSPANVSQR